MLLLLVSLRAPGASATNSTPRNSKITSNDESPNLTQKTIGCIILAIPLLHLMHFLFVYVSSFLHHGTARILGRTIPKRGTIYTLLASLMQQARGSALHFPTLTRILATLAIQYHLQWPMWISVSSVLHSCLILAGMRYSIARVAATNILEAPSSDGIYLRRAWIATHLSECERCGTLYAMPMCLLSFCFPLISFLVKRGQYDIIILLFTLAAIAQRAVRFRIMVKPEYLESHMQVGNALTQLTGPATVVVLTSCIASQAYCAHHYQIRLFCCMLIHDLKCGAAPERHSTCSVSPSSETRGFRVLIFATLFCTGACDA